MKTTREIARAFLVTDRFVTRHIGPSPDETEAMLATLGYSSLDEATAAAEAVHLTQSVTTVPAGATPVYLVAENCHPQTIAVLQTRAGARGLKVQVADPARFRFTPGVIGALVQYPTTDGAIAEYAGVCAAAHAAGALVTAATDLLALTLLQPPGEWGADIAIGPSQRFR